MKQGDKWRSLKSVFMSAQRLRETALGCPECHDTIPVEIQIRAEAPPNVYRCRCGCVWSVKNGHSIPFSAAIPWSDQ